MGDRALPCVLRVPKPLRHQEAVGGKRQTGMVLEAAPASAPVIAQPQVLRELLAVALNAPAHLGYKHHALDGHVLG